jgi:hypothetical protein
MVCTGVRIKSPTQTAHLSAVVQLSGAVGPATGHLARLAPGYRHADDEVDGIPACHQRTDVPSLSVQGARELTTVRLLAPLT